MQVMVNGEQLELEADASVADLLRRYQLDPRHVAVEVNCALVPRKTFAGAALRNGDHVEVVTFVGGG